MITPHQSRHTPSARTRNGNEARSMTTRSATLAGTGVSNTSRHAGGQAAGGRGYVGTAVRRARVLSWCIALFALMAVETPGAVPPPQAGYVIVISVDGMGTAYVKPLLTGGPATELTTFKRIQAEGSGTLNARDDADFAITLPNHVTMLTGRGVAGPAGHGWTSNTDPKRTEDLTSNKGSYVASAFDVAHDHGLRTGIWSGKSKFRLFHKSYGATTGAEDRTGPDNGRDKIDCEKIVPGIAAADLTDDFVRQMAASPCHFAFLHYQDPDATGHASGWSAAPTSPYAATLKKVDTAIGRVLQMVTDNPRLAGKTVVILTADHGGHDKTHGNTTNPLDYTIPFYVWGAAVPAAGDLYAMNATSRTAPAAAANPPYTGRQPIRNGDAANLALRLLGLGPVPGSTINSKQDLSTAAKTAVTIP